MKTYGGPIGRAMCRLPCDDVHATIDDVDVTIDDVRCVNVIAFTSYYICCTNSIAVNM